MKNLLKSAQKESVSCRKQISFFTMATFAFLMTISGCQKDDLGITADSSASVNSEATARRFNPKANYNQVNLVSDITEYDAALLDPNLVNAWGIAFGPTGGIWISSAEGGVSVIYDQNGNTLRPPVAIPFGTGTANPTGQVFNATDKFIIPSSGKVSRFIFATENGTIAAWAGGNTAVTVADRSAMEAVYKGLEMVERSDGSWVLYATDFHNGKVDMFDDHFAFIGNDKFADANIPAGFVPFNIKWIGSRLFVTYGKQKAPDNEDDEAGLGNGYVNIFNAQGELESRFASQGTLNSPWGVELMKADNRFGISPQLSLPNQTILIGNFGDGHINAFDGLGKFLGQLKHNGDLIEIEGLWALSYPPQGNKTYLNARNRIYFTAGVDDEEHGLFGYIMKADDVDEK